MGRSLFRFLSCSGLGVWLVEGRVVVRCHVRNLPGLLRWIVPGVCQVLKLGLF